MGGRGRNSGMGAKQYTFSDELKRREILEIKIESTKKRESIVEGSVGNGIASPRLLKKCACCGNYTIPTGSEYETCPICDWIDDLYQNRHPDSLEGKNSITLSQARNNYVRLQK